MPELGRLVNYATYGRYSSAADGAVAGIASGGEQQALPHTNAGMSDTARERHAGSGVRVHLVVGAEQLRELQQRCQFPLSLLDFAPMRFSRTLTSAGLGLGTVRSHPLRDSRIVRRGSVRSARMRGRLCCAGRILRGEEQDTAPAQKEEQYCLARTGQARSRAYFRLALAAVVNGAGQRIEGFEASSCISIVPIDRPSFRSFCAVEACASTLSCRARHACRFSLCQRSTCRAALCDVPTQFSSNAKLDASARRKSGESVAQRMTCATGDIGTRSYRDWTTT